MICQNVSSLICASNLTGLRRFIGHLLTYLCIVTLSNVLDTETTPMAVCQQELSYHKQIACQLRTQYIEGIDRPKYYTVTLKCHSRSLEMKPLDRSYATYY